MLPPPDRPREREWYCIWADPHLQAFGSWPAQREDVVLHLASKPRGSYHGAIAHFLDRLEDGGAFTTAPADNLETLRIVGAACRAEGFFDRHRPTAGSRLRALHHEFLIHQHEATSP